MQSFDVVIVGGGPAGSSCAWGLRNSGLRVAILDRAHFPRHKVCGGWVTPQVFDDLRIDPAGYACGRVLQPITGFLTAILGSRELQTGYAAVVSYGVRRCEFDSFLLARSGAAVFEGVEAAPIRRSGASWVVADRFHARLLMGAGGHFCPVARMLGAAAAREPAVLAQEAEFEIPPGGAGPRPVRGEIPELYFCPDMKGYGWCFRKGPWLNIGFGRLERQGIPRQAAAFFEFLSRAGKLPAALPRRPCGHAYLLYGSGSRAAVGDAVLLVGDAAGLAYPRSGEGIRPAVESGLLAAKCILAAGGNYERAKLLPYRDFLHDRFGRPRPSMAACLPPPAIRFLARHAMNRPSFARGVVLDRWFLHRADPPLAV